MIKYPRKLLRIIDTDALYAALVGIPATKAAPILSAIGMLESAQRRSQLRTHASVKKQVPLKAQ